MALIFFKTFSGVQAVNYYSPRIFEQLGFAGTQNALFASQSSTSSTLLSLIAIADAISLHPSAGIYGTVKFVFTVFFGFFIGKSNLALTRRDDPLAELIL